MFFWPSSPEGAPRWRGPAKILDVDDGVVTVKFHGQAFKVARYCVRKKAEAQDAGEADWGRALRGSDTRDDVPLWNSGRLPLRIGRLWSGEARLQKLARLLLVSTLMCMRLVDLALPLWGMFRFLPLLPCPFSCPRPYLFRFDLRLCSLPSIHIARHHRLHRLPLVDTIIRLMFSYISCASSADTPGRTQRPPLELDRLRRIRLNGSVKYLGRIPR